VVDRDILTRKLLQAAHHVERLRDKLAAPPDPETGSESDWNDLLMDLLQALQPCIDLAVHVVSHEVLGTPEGPASAFAILAREGILTRELSLRLAGASGLRNIIVHRYGDLTRQKVLEELPEGLADIEAFLTAVRAHGDPSRGRA
jgi:uncharacterized protein YutE (UPF0331/DUF86 family)